jgi:4'-phosphopantetheinyl transferase EntD
VHKAVAPVSGVTLGFHDVELRFDRERASFDARLVGPVDGWLPDFARLRGRYDVRDGYVMTTVVIPAEASGRDSSKPSAS